MRFSRSLRFWTLVFFGPFALAWLVMAVVYAVTPAYIDHLEPSMTVAAQQWLHGLPLYHPVDGPFLYSLLEGPLAYLSLALSLTLCPDPVLASKLSGGFWSLASLGLLLLIFWRSGGGMIAIASVGLVGGELMLDLFTPFWDRPDPILIFSTSLGLGALALRNPKIGGAVLVLAIAMAIDSKVHGVLYLLPSLAVWCRRHGWASCFLIVGLGATLSFALFLLPGVSLENYFHWLQMGARHPRTLDIFYENVETLLELILPLVLFVGHPQLKLKWRKATEETVLFYALLLSGLLVCIPASKLGSGWHHLLPLAVYVGQLFCVLLKSSPDQLKWSWAMGVVMVWTFFTYKQVTHNCSYVVWYLQNIPSQAAQADLRQFLRAYPADETQMGVGRGGGYLATFSSPWIYREGTPCVLNVGAFMDMKESGLNAEAVKKSLETEQFRYWICPHDGPPFTMESWYDSQPLFDDSVRQAFAQHYVWVGNTSFFDVYEAKTRVK